MVSTYQQQVQRALYCNASDEQMKLIGQIEKKRMEACQCYIGMRGSHNIAEMSDVPKDRDGDVRKALVDAGPSGGARAEDPLGRPALAACRAWRKRRG